jgi:hypothetical protein
MAASRLNPEIINLENTLRGIQLKDNFNPFTYNFNNDNRNRPVSSTIESLGLKHALNIELRNNVVFVNEEKGYYMDENKSGICYGKKIFK